MNLNSPLRNLLKTPILVAILALPFVAVCVGAADADTAKTATTTTASAPADSKADAVANSVVKVFSTMRYPNPYEPWTKRSR